MTTPLERFEAKMAEHAKWREETLPSEKITTVAHAVQEAAAKLLEAGVTITEIEVDRLPKWNRAKGIPPSIEVMTVAGPVTVRSQVTP